MTGVRCSSARSAETSDAVRLLPWSIEKVASILWKNLGYENDYEENVLFDDYRQIGPYTFDFALYERALRQAIESLEALTR